MRRSSSISSGSATTARSRLLAACPRKAILQRPEDGIVLIDQNRCRGYKKCVEQCPYKEAVYRGTRVSEKCIACYPRIEGRTADRGERWNALSGRLRGQDSDAELVRIGRTACGRKIGGIRSIFPRFAWSGGPAAVPAVGYRAQWLLHPPAPQLRAAYARADVSAGVDNAIEKYRRLQAGTLGGALQLWRPASRSSFVRCIPGPKVFETPDPRETLWRCTTIRAGLSTSRQGSGGGIQVESDLTFGRPSAVKLALRGGEARAVTEGRSAVRDSAPCVLTQRRLRPHQSVRLRAVAAPSVDLTRARGPVSGRLRRRCLPHKLGPIGVTARQPPSIPFAAQAIPSTISSPQENSLRLPRSEYLGQQFGRAPRALCPQCPPPGSYTSGPIGPAPVKDRLATQVSFFNGSKKRRPEIPKISRPSITAS